jgi:CspA family cold shock protein
MYLPATSTSTTVSTNGHSFDLDALAGPLHFRERQLKEGDTRMANGTVKWFNTTKGYGFIAPEGGGKDVFVHISAVERSGLTGLADNQKVTYDLAKGRDGRESAENLVLA